jgi:hypothetical protein
MLASDARKDRVGSLSHLGAHNHAAISSVSDGYVMSCSSGYVAIPRETFLGDRQSDARSPDEIRRKNLHMVETMMAPGVWGDYLDLVKRVGAATSGQAVQNSVKAVGAATQEDGFAALAAIRGTAPVRRG